MKTFKEKGISIILAIAMCFGIFMGATGVFADEGTPEEPTVEATAENVEEAAAESETVPEEEVVEEAPVVEEETPVVEEAPVAETTPEVVEATPEAVEATETPVVEEVLPTASAEASALPTEATVVALSWNLPEEALLQWSAVEENTEINLVDALEVKAFDATNNEVTVTVKDNGGLDLTTPGTYTITFAATNPSNNEEETQSVVLTINGEELASPLAGTCTITAAQSYDTTQCLSGNQLSIILNDADNQNNISMSSSSQIDIPSSVTNPTYYVNVLNGDYQDQVSVSADGVITVGDVPTGVNINYGFVDGQGKYWGRNTSTIQPSYSKILVTYTASDSICGPLTPDADSTLVARSSYKAKNVEVAPTGYCYISSVTVDGVEQTLDGFEKQNVYVRGSATYPENADGPTVVVTLTKRDLGTITLTTPEYVYDGASHYFVSPTFYAETGYQYGGLMVLNYKFIRPDGAITNITGSAATGITYETPVDRIEDANSKISSITNYMNRNNNTRNNYILSSTDRIDYLWQTYQILNKIDAGTYSYELRLDGPTRPEDRTFYPSFVITKRPITITANSASQNYNGSALADDGYTIGGMGLASGERIQSIDITGSQTNVGTSNNVASNVVILNASGEDITYNYDVTYVAGSLTVNSVATPTPVVTPTPNPGRTCQDDGYPAGYYWNGTACVIDATPVPVTPRPTTRPVVVVTPTPTTKPTTTPTASTSVTSTTRPTASATASITVTNQATDSGEHPAYGAQDGSWALINLIAALGSLLLAIILIAKGSTKEEDSEDTKRVNSRGESVPYIYTRKKMYKFVLGVVAVVSVLLFIITENITKQMVIFDNWTIWMVLLAALSVVGFILGSKWTEDYNEEENRLSE